MPVFTAIGTALGASTAVGALATGVAATAVVGASVFAAGQSKGVAQASQAPVVPSFDSRVSDAAAVGKITEVEAQTTAKKRAFRSGVLFTSPTGLDSDSAVASAKLR